jgi:hypothetical protein
LKNTLAGPSSRSTDDGQRLFSSHARIVLKKSENVRPGKTLAAKHEKILRRERCWKRRGREEKLRRETQTEQKPFFSNDVQKNYTARLKPGHCYHNGYLVHEPAEKTCPFGALKNFGRLVLGCVEINSRQIRIVMEITLTTKKI